jgi:hypothetical protein
VGGVVQFGPLGTATTNRPIVPAPGDYDNREIGGMISKGNRSTRRKPALVPLGPPQTPHAARTRTRAAAVGSQWLTAWATARPQILVTVSYGIVHVRRFFSLFLARGLVCHLSESQVSCQKVQNMSIYISHVITWYINAYVYTISTRLLSV